MQPEHESSDAALLNLLRRNGPMSISQLIDAMDVTATAVRQRLGRLMGQGMIARVAAKSSRGRPSHRYSLTEKGVRAGGSNFADLAIALWTEVRKVKDPAVRSGLIQRLAEAMAKMYTPAIQGATTAERMDAIRQLLAERDVPFAVEEAVGHNGAKLPVLTALACPYPVLAEQDRGICSVEKILFSELLGEGVRLTECRLDGANCCRFETKGNTGIVSDSPLSATG